jgi:hypothetical protein
VLGAVETNGRQSSHSHFWDFNTLRNGGLVEPAPWIGDNLGKMWIGIAVAAFISVRSCWTGILCIWDFSSFRMFCISFVTVSQCQAGESACGLFDGGEGSCNGIWGIGKGVL